VSPKPLRPASSRTESQSAAPGLEAAGASFVGWTLEAALPLWATAGYDEKNGRFRECLTLDAMPIEDAPLRLMTQARQIHVYALAGQRGWYGGAADRLERAFSSMVRDYHGRDGMAGWAFSIEHGGDVIDARRDLYAHAFVVLAVASYVTATGNRAALAIADETLAFIDGNMRAPEGGGFIEQLPPSTSLRRQNPHMHLFEAALALWECTAEQCYLRWAEELFELFADRFYRPDPGVVVEYFTPALRPADGEAGDIVEPGHQHEWIWLLRRFELATGREVQRYVDALYSYAGRHGFDSAGMIVDEVLIDGSCRSRSRRIWPITEAIKANLVEARAGRPGTAETAVALLQILRRQFLTAAPTGGWLDKLDEHGTCLSKFMPASTLYHLVGAVDEVSRHCAATTMADNAKTGGAPTDRQSARRGSEPVRP
jgi:mannose/cellobiose epimerase-like protein (N-acyl-D-glucosamine 2-epimerase family)